MSKDKPLWNNDALKNLFKAKPAPSQPKPTTPKNPPGMYVFKIELDGITPKIWRRIKVDPATSLDLFHTTIQCAMGWSNCHLHKFIYEGKEYYQDPEEVQYYHSCAPSACKKDGEKMKHNINLDEMDLKVGGKIFYEYDFGDCWEHTIYFEKIVDKVEGEELPMLLAGRNACPPEDVGGRWGYARMLELLKTKGEGKYAKDYKDRMEWLYALAYVGEDEEFDAKKFDLKENQPTFSLGVYNQHKAHEEHFGY